MYAYQIRVEFQRIEEELKLQLQELRKQEQLQQIGRRPQEIAAAHRAASGIAPARSGAVSVMVKPR